MMTLLGICALIAISGFVGFVIAGIMESCRDMQREDELRERRIRWREFVPMEYFEENK